MSCFRPRVLRDFRGKGFRGRGNRGKRERGLKRASRGSWGQGVRLWVWVEGVGRWETGIGFDFESFSLESYLGI